MFWFGLTLEHIKVHRLLVKACGVHVKLGQFIPFFLDGLPFFDLYFAHLKTVKIFKGSFILYSTSNKKIVWSQKKCLKERTSGEERWYNIAATMDTISLGAPPGANLWRNTASKSKILLSTLATWQNKRFLSDVP